MKKKHKSYSRPKRPFDKTRIIEEAEIKEKFGLKNKKEIWKSDSKIKSIREKAKKLISADVEEQQALFDRLRKKGFKVNSISDVLSLTKEDYLERRLQTVLVSKGMANTPKSARQLITHKKVSVGGKLVDSPAYIVPSELEDQITLKVKKDALKKKEEVVESKEEKVNEEGGEKDE
ncbi:MAG: 30S ribosomal protein S4 [Nanoarchaeota archaeon]|nr:30S ribosomal protein S4 [Nanoarchaeota archaeon]